MTAAGSNAGEETRNPTDGAVMVWVPAGPTVIGTNPDEGAEDECPQSMVVLPAYWIYKNEVTVAQYRAYCTATNRQMPSPPPWGWQDAMPIVRLRWQEALDYATWAGGTLPTEHQWEKAARGPEGRRFPWGDTWDPALCNSRDRGPGKPQPVGSYPRGASPYGCLDMTGNVSEWCREWFLLSYYTDERGDPPKPGRGAQRAVRGGSWLSSIGWFLRPALRHGMLPGSRPDIVGFRCVVEMP